MLGMMNDYPLNIQGLLEYSERNNSDVEIVSRRVEGDIHRYTYADFGRRARKLADALLKIGISSGDVCGTIAWNGYRHMELYFALPGIGAIYHTINPRFSDEQIIYVINHANDKYLFVERTFVPILERIADRLTNVKGFIILCDAKDMPSTELANAVCYESFLEAGSDSHRWTTFDENSACAICYTSGTTGDPKGVVYSHRALILQCFNFVIGTELNCRDVVLPVVPMFHVNGWTLPFSSTLLGMKLVLPGPALDGANIFTLMETEKVTFSAGVPTVWQMLLEHAKSINGKLPDLKKVLIGGSAAPRSMIEEFADEYNVDAIHAWGMTETSSMGSSPALPSAIVNAGKEAVIAAKMRQGRACYGIEMRIVDENGKELPRDGKSAGLLQVRGWAVANAYLGRVSEKDFKEDGWFETGDVATIDARGFLQLTDRAKDMIKSGGEWISSIALEIAAMRHPNVREAAVIGIHHPKWDERPLLIVVPNGEKPATEDLLDFLRDQVASWWLPDAIEFVKELPHGPTGKVDKKRLRELRKSNSIS